MKFENYTKAVDIRNQIIMWIDYRSCIENRIKLNSEVIIPEDKDFTPIRDSKVEISKELISRLTLLVENQIDILKNEFKNL